MSDPVSNIEIEDVLSSIRRLVSEETGAQPRPEPARQPPKENRLVLTPALRVQDEPEDPLTQDEDVEQVKVDPQPQDEAPWNNPYATLYSTAKIEPEANPDPQNEPENNPEPQNSLAEDPVSTDQEAEDVSEAPADDPDALGDAAEEGPYVFVMKNDEQQTDAELDDVADDVEDELVEAIETQHEDLHVSSESDNDEAALPKDIGSGDLMPLSAKIAALETAIGETQDQWEPDGATGDDYAGTPVRTLRWQDHEAENPDSDDVNSDGPKSDGPNSDGSEEERAATVQEEIPGADEQRFDTDADQDNELDVLVSDDSIMDEESLRELVAEIVHAELQGALGERITRNVRKLVRREIHRALTTQQLD